MESTANILIVEDRGRRSVPLVGQACSFGRDPLPDVDISCDAPIVSRRHGRFFCKDGDWYYQDMDSLNGTFVDEYHVYHDTRPRRMVEGTTLRIDDVRSKGKHHRKGILIYFFYGDLDEKYEIFELSMREGGNLILGRDSDCQIRLNTVSVSGHHGVITRTNGEYYYDDLSSMNGSYLNGVRVQRKTMIHRQDVLVLGNIKLLFLGNAILFQKPETGSYIIIRGLTRVVRDYDKRSQRKTILDDVNADIAEGKLVAILGTSGAGKTTFMNCVIGYEPPTSGSVLIDGTDLYTDTRLRKSKIGYVPQEDLLRGGLSLERTLDFIGRLRLPKDVTRQERKQRIQEILRDLDLEPTLQHTHIRKLSGGQRKRVSIASELVSDPPLLFLDEPTSGLDPETETKLVFLMKKLAHERGKTLMVVTHTIRNIMEFDQILFFGPGGRLCFSGSPQKAVQEFKVRDFADIYPLVSQESEYYADLQKRKLR